MRYISMYIPKYINHFTSVRHGHFTSVQTTLYNRVISVANTLNKTSVHTTLINYCEYIYEYIQSIYHDNSTAFLYRFFISSGYILRYIPCDVLPCKPLVVYVSGYTMIKCVLYTCIYPGIYLLYIVGCGGYVGYSHSIYTILKTLDFKLS